MRTVTFGTPCVNVENRRDLSYGELAALEQEFDKQMENVFVPWPDLYIEAFNDFCNKFASGDDDPKIYINYTIADGLEEWVDDLFTSYGVSQDIIRRVDWDDMYKKYGDLTSEDVDGRDFVIELDNYLNEIEMSIEDVDVTDLLEQYLWVVKDMKETRE